MVVDSKRDALRHPVSPYLMTAGALHATALEKVEVGRPALTKSGHVVLDVVNVVHIAPYCPSILLSAVESPTPVSDRRRAASAPCCIAGAI